MVQTIYIDPNTGNLGIGTTAAKQALDITNNLSVGGFIGIGTTTEFSSASSSLGLFITKDISVGRGAGGYIGENMYWTGSQWQRYNTNAGGFAFRIGSSSDGYGESFQLLTINTTGTTTLPAMVCANGNLGIGTTNPLQSLHIRGNNPNMIIQSVNNASFSTIATPGIVFRAANTTVANTTGIFLNEADGLGVWANGAERMRFKWNGYVGIGTTDPVQSLHISGFMQAGIPSVTGGGVRIVPANNSAWYDITNTLGTLIVQGVGQTPYLSYNGSATWSYVSDIRFKKDILSLNTSNALNNLMQLNPVDYLWNHEDNSINLKHFGFIAQEIETIFPSIVNKRVGDDNVPDGISLSLSYTDFIPIIVASIKEQQTMITDLRKEVEQLKQMIKSQSLSV